MTAPVERIEDMSREGQARFLMDLFHRIVMHYAMWFAEVGHQMGPQRAYEVLKTASQRSVEIQLKRLSRRLGFEMTDGVPRPLVEMPAADLLALIDDVAVNWLANDGVWFQAVEFANGMTDAKRCNDSCWAHFSPFEARDICRFLALPSNPGLDGLKKALQFRVYARVNTQSITDETPTSFVFQMNECRVQAARKRKNLDDYPCKSGGMVEYSYFARSIDPRIRTECIGCPPDAHPDSWYCAWRFILEKT